MSALEHVVVEPDPETNTLVDTALHLHPSPADAGVYHVRRDAVDDAASDEEEVPVNERTRLLARPPSSSRSSSMARKELPWWRRPSPYWIFPLYIIVALCKTAIGTRFTSFHTSEPHDPDASFPIACLLPPKKSAPVELDVVQQIACRAVELEQVPIIIPPHAPVPGLFEPHDPDVDFLASPLRTFASPSQPTESELSTMSWKFRKPDMEATDPEWDEQCRNSAAVQKRTATYLGYWASLSDSIGRQRVLALSIAAILIDVGSMTLASSYLDIFGIKFLLAMQAVSSLFGAEQAAIAVSAAYLADCTRGQSKTAVLSILEASGAFGSAVGPLIGAALVKFGFLLLPYYVALVSQAVVVIFILLCLPESLSRTRKHEERVRRASLAALRTAARAQEAEMGAAERAKRYVKEKVELFLSPLLVLKPRDLGEVEEEHQPALRRPKMKPGRRDWNLGLVAVSNMLYLIPPAMTVVKILYARFVFGWRTEEVGGWISFVSGSKMAFLLVLLPLGIKLFRRPAPIPTWPRPSELSMPDADVEEVEAQLKKWDEEAEYLKLRSDSAFDLNLARSSIAVALLGYLLMGIPQTTSKLFLIGSAVVSWSNGAPPALQSLALALSSPRDAGKVLGAISMLRSVSLMLIGPTFFGILYVKTVDMMPTAIFFSAVGWFVLALVPAFAVRIEGDERDDVDSD
ncbi:hypothetical protein MNV49_003158 [Pseudohyphozyma bogoriensis]|nr:hypothetical protein MNV49_003158 [Pseudohyphozyma bogoriensis]